MKHIDEFKTIYDYMSFFLDSWEYDIFKNHTQQDARGFFTLRDTHAATAKTGLSKKKLQRVVRRIEGLARLWELVLLDRE